MITILIVLILTIIGCVIWGIKDDSYSDAPSVFIIIGVLLLIICLFTSIKFQISSSNLTGYIYQRSDAFGYVTYDLRYSQGAGSDSQPSFCVKSGSDEDIKMQKYVGTDTKVSIVIPSSGFRIANNIFECPSSAKLDKIFNEKNTSL